MRRAGGGTPTGWDACCASGCFCAPLHPSAHAPSSAVVCVQVRERRKEIASLQAEVKKLQGEMRAQQGGGAAAAGSGAAPGSAGVVGAAGGSAPPSAATSPLPPLPPARATRRARDPQAEIEGMVEKISYLEAAMGGGGQQGAWGGGAAHEPPCARCLLEGALACVSPCASPPPDPLLVPTLRPYPGGPRAPGARGPGP